MLNPKRDVHSSLLIGQTTYLSLEKTKVQSLCSTRFQTYLQVEISGKKRKFKTTKDYNTSPASPNEKWVTVSIPSSRAVTRHAQEK